LPVCGRELALVEEMAAQGSPNHRLLVNLMKGGATLVGTESPDLLVEEYQVLQSPEERTEAKAAALLEARDRFIAGRIAETLGDGEDGILFIGALHDVAKFLPRRVRVEYLPIRSQ
jgi:pheromone shutdown protein TraB